MLLDPFKRLFKWCEIDVQGCLSSLTSTDEILSCGNAGLRTWPGDKPVRSLYQRRTQTTRCSSRFQSLPGWTVTSSPIKSPITVIKSTGTSSQAPRETVFFLADYKLDWKPLKLSISMGLITDSWTTRLPLVVFRFSGQSLSKIYLMDALHEG